MKVKMNNLFKFSVINCQVSLVTFPLYIYKGKMTPIFDTTFDTFDTKFDTIIDTIIDTIWHLILFPIGKMTPKLTPFGTKNFSSSNRYRNAKYFINKLKNK